MKKLLLILLFSMPSYLMAQCLVIQDASSPGGWTGGLKITNLCKKQLHLSKMTISFPFDGAISSVWGAPWANWNVSKSGTNENYELKGNTGSLAEGQSAKILFSTKPKSCCHHLQRC